jgi:predicted phage-related endonuclease
VLKSNEVFEVVRFRQRTKADREAAWLAQRGLGVGGSDMSTILGVNKYQDAVLVVVGEDGSCRA